MTGVSGGNPTAQVRVGPGGQARSHLGLPPRDEGARRYGSLKERSANKCTEPARKFRLRESRLPTQAGESGKREEGREGHEQSAGAFGDDGRRAGGRGGEPPSAVSKQTREDESIYPRRVRASAVEKRPEALRPNSCPAGRRRRRGKGTDVLASVLSVRRWRHSEPRGQRLRRTVREKSRWSARDAGGQNWRRKKSTRPASA